ncbi:hypothetical protein OG777_07855 [Micromonospora peucetia]|uniref:hypothetical protein n=1 Tax=Micromonospora peucetia TaxID=47871 RepID=UPI0022574C67|nr:hypothetical protein [Micromonospora peucetia]MCX4386840.1 hypothetical protein [Micromonospora peucetia]
MPRTGATRCGAGQEVLAAGALPAPPEEPPEPDDDEPDEEPDEDDDEPDEEDEPDDAPVEPESPPEDESDFAGLAAPPAVALSEPDERESVR